MKCDCIEKANEALEPFNTVINTRESLNMKTGKISRTLLIPTRKANSRSRKQPKFLVAKFCPMCGTATGVA